MLKTCFAILALTIVFVVSAPAQGSGSMPDSGKNDSAFRVSKSIMGKALEVKDGKQLVIQQKNSEITLNLKSDTEIVAEDGADVPNAKRPVLGDIKKGQMLRVTYQPETKDAIEVRILRKKS